MISSVDPDRVPRWAFGAAVAAGVLGLVANALLTGYFALSWPSFSDPTWGWLGTANDVVLVGYFVLLIPVAVAVRRLLPVRRVVGVTTGVVVLALVTLALLQIALVAGLLDFDRQVLLVVGALVPVYVWLLVVSSLGHRPGTLPRSVTRLGLLLGISWPAALALTGAGFALSGSSAGSLELSSPGAVLLVPALVLGSLNWLLFPIWPLLLAGAAFRSRGPAPARTTSPGIPVPSGEAS
jgi:hypothetical protein